MPSLGADALSVAHDAGALPEAETEFGTTERLRDAVNEIVEQTPTVFGRLEALANLQKAPDEGLPIPTNLSCTSEQFRRAIESSHLDMLCLWLSRRWEYRLADARIYFTRRSQQAAQASTRMQQTESYRRLVPAQAQECQKEHFLMEVRILLSLAAASLE